MVTCSEVDVQWSRRILGEYRAMPGLRLTLRQAARFWALDVDRCQVTLDGLVAAGHLRRDRRGQYCLGDSFESAGRR